MVKDQIVIGTLVVKPLALVVVVFARIVLHDPFFLGARSDHDLLSKR